MKSQQGAEMPAAPGLGGVFEFPPGPPIAGVVSTVLVLDPMVGAVPMMAVAMEWPPRPPPPGPPFPPAPP